MIVQRHCLVVFDEETGVELWQRQWPATYRNLRVTFATGPRATPTVDGDRVYVLGAAGMRSCFETEAGALVWRVDMGVDYESTVPVQGTTHAPLVEGDLLIAVVDGDPDAKVVAFNKVTGAVYSNQDYAIAGGLAIATPVHSGRYLTISQRPT